MKKNEKCALLRSKSAYGLVWFQKKSQKDKDISPSKQMKIRSCYIMYVLQFNFSTINYKSILKLLHEYKQIYNTRSVNYEFDPN